ncbi:DUF4124 domain-containing protein [Pseudoteredinibacter isoporae]|uniref:DUF4124 domain-containing protein n=1 Tax=Pseudoteredinibacter isoporae TaxID=570281 RepID=UPI00333F4A34
MAFIIAAQKEGDITMPFKATLISTSCIALCCLATGLISNDALAAKKFYKWVDKDGVTHYSERPPRGQKAQVVTTYAGRGTPATSAAPKADEEDSQETNKQEAAAQQSEPAAPTKNPRICQSARRNLDILERSNRVRLQDENGELKTLSNEEKEKQRRTAQQAVEQHCE